MILDTKPTSILLFEGTNESLDQIAARLTLATNRRHTRADAHRFVLGIGIDAVNRAASLAENVVAPCPTFSSAATGADGDK